jgi:hypothetical protein
VVSIFSREQRCAYQFIEQYKQEFPVVVLCRVHAALRERV